MKLVQNWAQDSSRWHGFRYRADDIVVASWMKSGTTLVQQIVAQLVFPKERDLAVIDACPWVESHFCPPLARSAKRRRILKTHLPLDALPFSLDAKYIYVTRDGRDALWSWYDHHCQFTPLAYKLINTRHGRIGPQLEAPGMDVRRYFHVWLDRDGHPVWPYWSHIESWWESRNVRNVLLLRYADIRANLERAIAVIASFLGISPEEVDWPTALERCSFEYMKANAASLSRALDALLIDGAASFVNKGQVGRWRGVLTADDIRKYEARGRQELGEECYAWVHDAASSFDRHALAESAPALDRTYLPK
jgi:aryl sulfotransferase